MGATIWLLCPAWGGGTPIFSAPWSNPLVGENRQRTPRSTSGLTRTTCFCESFLLRSAPAIGWEKDNVRRTLPRGGSSGRNRSAYPVVPFARVNSLYQQKEARPRHHVAESLVRLDVSRLGLGPDLGVHAQRQRSPSTACLRQALAFARPSSMRPERLAGRASRVE